MYSPVIYKITNPLGLVYIGQTRNIQQRIKSHRFCSPELTRIYESFKNYGFKNHVFDIIVHCDIKDLDELEIYYINEYNSNDPMFGLNCTTGGVHGKLYGKSFEKYMDSVSKRPIDNKNFHRGINLSQKAKDTFKNALVGISKKPTHTSQYTGVSWNTKSSKWVAQIRHHSKKIFLGEFTDEYKAHLAYQKKLSELKKEYQSILDAYGTSSCTQ